MITSTFYSQEELEEIGFHSIGTNCLISRKASFYCPNKITIGDNVRIDDFCIISGNITLGNNIHISAFVALYGSNKIIFEDYTGISTRSTIYSAMDDFSGNYLIGPVHPIYTRSVTEGPVIIKKYSHIGAHSLIFPNLSIGPGTVVGACSMVNCVLEPWSVCYGIPAKKRKGREKGMVKFTSENLF